MKCPHCPVPDGEECKSYAILCENLAKNPKRWRPVLDRVNSHLEPTNATTEYPSILTQAANAVAAAGRFAASGFATVDQAEFDRRRAICAGCEHFDAAKEKCRACGCSLAIKPWSKSERCPVGKWATRPATPE